MVTTYPTTKTPGVWIPIAMSLAAFVIVIVNISLFGVTQQGDEGAAAHMFQLLMAGQLPVMLFFLVKWLPQAPVQVCKLLFLQVTAALLPLAVIFYFKL